jgi:hypothetical protein
LIKYTGALHSYLRHTILMFNPSNLDEVCVQATHLEARGRNDIHKGNKKTFSHGEKGKKWFKDNGRKNAAMKKEGENFTCKHCQKMAMMKTIVGSFILKEDPKGLATITKGSQRLLRLFNKI